MKTREAQAAKERRVPVTDPARWAAFRANPCIGALAGNARWCVSTEDKVPVDMGALSKGRLWGVPKRPRPDSMTTLDGVDAAMPEAANRCYLLSAAADRVCVLDIESHCPEPLRTDLARIQCLWRETSMSGRGLHLVMPVPAAVWGEVPEIVRCRSLRSPDGHYEVLLNQNVTFMGALTAPPEGPLWPMGAFEGMFMEMARAWAALRPWERSAERSRGMAEATRPVTDALAAVLDGWDPQHGPERFEGDMSRFEFGRACYALRRLSFLLRRGVVDGPMGEAERARVAYEALVATLDWRPKHDEVRDGDPWLLYQVHAAMARGAGSER